MEEIKSDYYYSIVINAIRQTCDTEGGQGERIAVFNGMAPESQAEMKHHHYCVETALQKGFSPAKVAKERMVFEGNGENFPQTRNMQCK